MAASLEYFDLDPVFDRLVFCADPDGSKGCRAAVDAHVAHLALAMESRGAWADAPWSNDVRGVLENAPSVLKMRSDGTGGVGALSLG